ncbi:hypothetical protein BDV59DRAFT_200969 [Aspergillus ambiguus]|uniref:uncharacterized protein n=1 Tax=Aspergillus ambiguus TaxID=176160 RepID=UPI003CCE29A5
MHLPRLPLWSLLSVLVTATTTAASALTLTIPPSTVLPNPNALPAGTHATLTSLPSTADADALALSRPLTAPLTRSATFVFRNLPPSSQPTSYLLDIRSAEYIFAPYRVDVAADGSVLGVWETFRGNPWDNRGQEKFVVDVAVARAEDVTVDARVVARRAFYEQRSKFSPLSLFKNPMILLALVALGFTFGMPKLMENMDPEMRAEFEAHSRASPLSGAARGAVAGGGGPAPNFDLAGWMAGATPRAGAAGGPAPAQGGATTAREGGAVRRRG